MQIGIFFPNSNLEPVTSCRHWAFFLISTE